MNKHMLPLENFFKNPSKTGYQLSPKGTKLCYLAPYKNRKNIFIQDIDQKEASQTTRRISSVLDRDIPLAFWGDEEHILYMRDFDGDENYHIFSINIHTLEEKDLTPFPGVKVDIINTLPEDEQHLIIGMNKRNPQFFDAYKLHIPTGQLSLLMENPGNISSWICDHQGDIRLIITTDGVNQQFLYRSTIDSAFKSVLQTNFKESLSPQFFDFEHPHCIYALSNIGRDKLTAIRYDLERGEEIEVLFEHPEVDLSSISYSRVERKATAILYTTWKREIHFLDQQRVQRFQALQEQLQGYEIAFTSADKAEKNFILRSYNDRSLGAYYHYNSDSGHLVKLAEVSPWIEEEAMATMQPISYESRDGLKINGYLSLPKNTPGKNLPLVVNPHGGPWHRDSWGYNSEVQFLCSRGYAVLQMNFRGSTGYGKAFWQASFKQWGLSMQDDISDGVNYLIQEGIADPKRIAIYGGSYGGYATLAGICFTPELYSCAIDYVGVSNLFSFMATIPPYWKPYLEMLQEMVGNPEEEQDRQRMQATSPVFHVDKIRVPLLIAQGAKDPRVHQNESDQMVEALKKRGITVQYLLKENEGHGFLNEENKFEFYRCMQEFLAEHL